MILYHFTSHVHRVFVEREGLDRGECPVGWGRTLNHPNLTTDPEPARQGWTRGALVNKRAVRITVEIDDGDELLVPWLPLARQHGIERDCERALAKGAGDPKAWYVYRGAIPPERFRQVEVLAPPTEIEARMARDAAQHPSWDAFEAAHRVGTDQGQAIIDPIDWDILA